ncbi:MAG: GMC family oxidoreductase [Solirubrobacteraceae bacterium]|nr:GMC family oxidoreductase [Solirubrobacteraceae bacterium]
MPEGGVDVAPAVESLLAAVPSRTRAIVRLALRALEWSTFPRRLSRVGPERGAARIARLAESRLAPARELTALVKGLVCVAYARDPRVLAALGVEAGCEPAGDDPLKCGAGPEPPRLDPATLAPPDDVERCDVAIVGSGAGGAAAARALAEAGLDVVVLEQGELHDVASFAGDPLAALPALYRDAGLTICDGRPPIPVPVGRCVGGTTVVNSGTCLRPPGDVLVSWREDHGIGWATELDGELEAVERALGVTAVDPATAGRNAALCRAGAEAIGASNGPITRNAPPLRRCASCPTGCPRDAKRAMHVSELPRAVAAGARIRAGVRVHEVLLERGRAVGVAGRVGAERRRYELRARAVVLAGGALGTPELLLRQGIANRSGEVGRRLRIHPACWVGARFEEPVRGWDGVMQSWQVDEWLSRGLFLEATFTPLAFSAHLLPGVGGELMERLEAFDRLAIIGVHLSERSEGRVRLRGGTLRASYRLRGDDAAALRFGIARAADIHFAAGAREVYPQVAGIPTLRPGEQGALERDDIPVSALRLEGFHPMGTARMGADPRHSVVAPSGECHDVPGLYVADASIFPTSVKANPMLAIMACARRIAGEIAQRL